MPDDEFDDDEFDDIDEDTVVFSEVVKAPMRFIYQYDFGDNWQHEVVVETIEPVPLVLEVRRLHRRPAGLSPRGLRWDRRLRRSSSRRSTDPTHEEHVDYVEWVGRPFDPEAFTVAATNAALQRVR